MSTAGNPYYFRRRTMGRAASPPTWACYEQIHDDDCSNSDSDSCSEDDEDYPDPPHAVVPPQAPMLHAQLHTQVHPRHFWNEVLGNAGRASVSGAFTERCGGDEALFSRGVVQLDFLGRRAVFEGLTKGLKGMWEIKASKVD
ncbi:hypothetical protein NLJ89_g1068 [Agrocybe chaxingu]|uniref:DUF6699 domain-containing protein n=1 Tax=Agrocybe chaxingu TaxID=84603 RepID=A0A9W8N0N2_9AGAR|nr:hypothetical protein NLJ89_g1068 [Agrocybe chaxingu]